MQHHVSVYLLNKWNTLFSNFIYLELKPLKEEFLSYCWIRVNTVVISVGNVPDLAHGHWPAIFSRSLRLRHSNVSRSWQTRLVIILNFQRNGVYTKKKQEQENGILWKFLKNIQICIFGNRFWVREPEELPKKNIRTQIERVKIIQYIVSSVFESIVTSKEIPQTTQN
jgi:hypothetical protein